MSFPNEYVSRRVADTASKACDICYKATTTVLFSEKPEGKDFFYVCPIHLKDRKFCTPKLDPEKAEAERKKALDEEIKRVKEEYEAKKKTKEDKKKEKEKEGESDKKEKDKDDDKDDDNDKSKETKDKNEDENKVEASGTSTPNTSEQRTFVLASTFYDIRKRKRRDLELARRQHQQSQLNRQRMAQDNFFPSVPSGPPSKKA